MNNELQITMEELLAVLETLLFGVMVIMPLVVVAVLTDRSK